MATPTMIQHISTASNPALAGSTPGNAFKIPLTHPVRSGNCIILCITFTSGLTATITDNNSNSWGAATVTADAGGTFGKSQIFVLPNANAGQTMITVTFGSTSAQFTYTVSEWMNIATSSPVDGGSAVGFNSTVFNCPAAPYTTGSFTPTNAAGNDLIFAYFCHNGGSQTGTPTNWTVGGSFTLLDGDLGNGLNSSSAGGIPHATMYFIQSSSAAINPSITMTGDTADTVNALGIALKSAAAGTARASGIHVDRLIHQTNNVASGNLLSRCVFTGNLRVIVFGFTSSNELNVTGVTDSDGNTWTDATGGSTTKPLIYYKNNTSPSTNTLITIATSGTSGTSQQSWRIYDISGADTNAFDIYVGTAEAAFSTSTLSSAPVITPGVTSGIALGTVLVALNNAHSVTAPAGAVYDACDYTGNGSTDQLDNADGFGHFIFSNANTQNWAWTMVPVAGNDWWSAAATFKAAPVGGGASVSLAFGILGSFDTEW